MKKFFMKLTAIAVMPMLLAACTKDEVNPTPTNGGKEGEIELILKNESVADGTRAFGSGTTESWEKSISSAVLIVYNTSGTQILRRVLTAAEVNGSTTTPIKFVLPGVSADASCDFYVVINRNIADNITTKAKLLEELESDIASYNGTYANVTTKAMRSGGFAMTGTVTAKIVSGTTAVTVTVKRVVAKVEIQTSMTDSFRTKYGNGCVEVKKITLSRGDGEQICNRKFFLHLGTGRLLRQDRSVENERIQVQQPFLHQREGRSRYGIANKSSPRCYL